MVTLRTLPKVRDRISFLYFEHCRVEQELKAIAVFREQEKYIIPCASLSTLLLGPGTSITHAAIKTLADNACAVQWVGEDCLRFYAAGKGSSNKTDRGVCQAAINSVGYSSALGFIHTGNPLSFIHDVADLYKAETTIPAAFEAVAETYFDLDSVVRRKCREKFSQHRLMQRLIHDVDQVLQFKKSDEDGLAVSHLWDDQINWVEGGKNWSEV